MRPQFIMPSENKVRATRVTIGTSAAVVCSESMPVWTCVWLLQLQVFQSTLRCCPPTTLLQIVVVEKHPTLTAVFRSLRPQHITDCTFQHPKCSPFISDTLLGTVCYRSIYYGQEQRVYAILISNRGVVFCHGVCNPALQ